MAALRRRPGGVQAVASSWWWSRSWAVFAVTGTSSPGKSASNNGGRSATRSADSGLGLGKPSGVDVNQASTSTRGRDSATSINVVFPVSNLTSLASNFGFAGDTEFAAQKAAIHTFVNAINDAGGINGRKINPMIVNFDPTNEVGHARLCKQWTEGSPAGVRRPRRARLVDRRQRAVHHPGRPHPFIGQWTTVTNWTQEGAPYLWWTGPDQAQILATVVQWGKSSGLLTTTDRIGIVAGDRTSDQVALNQYLLPDLRTGRVHQPSHRDPARRTRPTPRRPTRPPLSSCSA